MSLDKKRGTSMSRKLYRGKFNWSGELIEEWVRADSETQAFRLLCARIGVLKGHTAYSVRQKFAGKASYTIQEIVEK